jgi:hypothetical protein
VTNNSEGASKVDFLLLYRHANYLFLKWMKNLT